MLSLTLLLLYFFLFIRGLPTINSICILMHLPFFFLLLFLGSLSIRRTFLPPTPFYLTSPSWRYIPSLCMHSNCHVLSYAFSLLLFYMFINLSSFFFFFHFFLFFFFRLIPNPFLFITPRVRRSLLLWAHLLKVSLMRRT